MNSENNKNHRCNDNIDDNELNNIVDEIILRHSNDKSSMILVLQDVQNLFGRLPKRALNRISDKMDKTYSEVAAAVQYFSAKQQSKHTIKLCMGTACYVRGGENILKTLIDKLGICVGETTPDNLFTLELGRCFGQCASSPVIVINEDIHEHVTPDKIDSILNKYR